MESCAARMVVHGELRCACDKTVNALRGHGKCTRNDAKLEVLNFVIVGSRERLVLRF